MRCSSIVALPGGSTIDRIDFEYSQALSCPTSRFECSARNPLVTSARHNLVTAADEQGLGMKLVGLGQSNARDLRRVADIPSQARLG